MSKTIKVIDLLNKIANGEEVPIKIKVDKKIYIYDKLEYFYKMRDTGDDLLQLCTVYSSDIFMNMEVEIIEDKQEIDIQNIGELTYKGEKVGYGSTEQFTDDIDDYCSAINSVLDAIGLKTNQLVQAVKQLDNKLKEK